ncbi:MAG: hypothetical protein JSV88_08555 [Candidatus Aminicenantes bacterium]|nr:MAG: hypothetical protein JSV88_08555 [Candidatus Aminicenantes bacterium]
MNACEQCGASIMEGSEFILSGKKGDLHRVICQTCATALENALDAETRDINVLGAVVFGLGAAVISALLWYAVVVITNYELGIVAVAVGWLVAQAVILGSGRKRGPVVQVISVLAIIFAMGLGEYLIIRHFLIKAGLENMPLFIPLKLVFNLLIEVIKEDPLMLVFWLIAVIEGIVLPAKRKLKLTRPTGMSVAKT